MLTESEIKFLDERELLLNERQSLLLLLNENSDKLDLVNKQMLDSGIEGWWYYNSETKSIELPKKKNDDRRISLMQIKEQKPFQFSRYPDSMEERAYKTKTP